MRKLTAGCALALIIGCSNAPPGDSPQDSRTDTVSSDLVTSLEVEIRTDTVRFVLHLTNSGTQPVVLEFNTGARYDFSVLTTSGSEVWRWSADMMFTQVLGSETIPSGGTVRYSAVWAPGTRSGTFTAVGKVLATNRAIEQRTNFEISKR